ncbi:MAG: hypothetical protein A7316_05195 [Candidatus Altiarchaeales archaeon WOR_SM1_86-2]|nr:MAG: hypothetical protein A7316_05195 [Candidatus Altiarchaeales archaeon WOR_SM1_86-2]
MSQLRDNFGKKFIATGEASPPPGPDMTEYAHEVEEMKHLMDKIEGVNVVDLPGARVLMSSLGASIYMLQKGVEPIFQMVVRDRNMAALQADLIAGAAFGIENILSLTGDHPACMASDHKGAKPVYDLDSATLIKTMKMLNDGKMLNGQDMNGKTNFFIGAAIGPTSSPLDGEVYKTKRKLDAGADFFQTQGIFDIEPMRDFLNLYDRLIGGDIASKTLVGIVPIRSYGMMQYLLTMPGVVIKDKIVNSVKEASDEQKRTGRKGLIEDAGINLCIDLVDEIKGLGMKGVHIMPVGNVRALKAIVDRL